MSKLFNLFFLIIVFSLLFSCKKEEATAIAVPKIIIDTVQHAWQAEPAFNGFPQNVSTACAANGIAIFYSPLPSSCLGYDSITNGWGIYPIGGSSFYDNKLPVSKNMCTTYGSSQVKRYNTINFTNPFVRYNNGRFGYAITFDTNFVSFIPNTNALTASIAISDSGRVIYPVITKDTTHAYFYFWDTGDSSYILTVKNFQKLSMTNCAGCVPQVTSFGNRFFVGINDTTYLVRENLTYKPVLNDVFNCIFKYQNNYYATGFGDGGRTIYQTTNNGETWSLQFTVNVNRYGLVILNFDNNLIAYLGDQLWQVSITSTTINFKEIVNDGLTGKTITGLVKCNNKVWVSTNGGVFYRPYSNFYQFK